MKFYRFATLAAVCIVASPAATRQVIYQGDIAPSTTFDNGYLIVYDGPSRNGLSVFGPDGLRRYTTSIQIPLSRYLYILNAAADTDGTVAIAFADYTNSGKFGFVMLDPTGKQVRIVLTGTYRATQVCFAPDHTIWLSGYDLRSKDYMIFQKYTLDGNSVGGFVPRSALGSLAAIEMVGARMMRASAQGIVALLQSQPVDDPGHLEWVELDLSGHVIDQPGQHRNFLPWALTPDGTIYAQEAGDKIVFWNRAAGVWKSAAITPQGSLEGADQNGLIFRLPNTATFQWVPVNN